MDIKTAQKLINQTESASLEFKGSIDLKNERAKAKFIKEVLSLANMGGNPSYLIIGVHDKTKEITGFTGYTEVDIQNFIRDWCLPPINFEFHIVTIESENLGVMEIFGDHKLHRIKRALHYVDTDGKPKEIRENSLFIRRGSRVDEATLEEIIEIARQRDPNIQDIISKIDELSEANDEIVRRSGPSDWASEDRDQMSREIMETIFVSGLSGGILGLMWNPDASWLSVAALPVTFFSIITTAIFRITHFGVRHTIVAGLLLGTALSVWFTYGLPNAPAQSLMSIFPLMSVILNALVAGVVGLIAGIIFLFWRPLDF